MTVQSESRCDLCGILLPPVTEEWIMQDTQKYEWIMINEKFLCKKCVIAIINEVNCLGLTDCFKQEAEG